MAVGAALAAANECDAAEPPPAEALADARAGARVGVSMACGSGASQDRAVCRCKRVRRKNKMDETTGYHLQLFVHDMGGTMGNVNLLHG